MQKALKVTFGAIIAVGVASVHAHAREDFLHNVGITAGVNYSKSTNNGLTFGDTDVVLNSYLVGANNGFDGPRRHVFVEPENDWGYNVGLSYHAPGSHTHYYVNFESFTDEKEDSAENLRNLSVFTGEGPGPDAFVGSFAGGNGRTEHHHQEFAAGMKHLLHFGHRFNIDLGAFFEYNKLTRTFYQRNLGVEGAFGFSDTDEKVHGWGPGVGFGTHTILFRCAPKWGLFVNAKSSLLYTHNDYHQYVEFSDEAEDGAGFYYYEPEQSKSIVSKFDIKFGIDYASNFRSDLGRMCLDIALGMRYMNMINAFKNGNVYMNTIRQQSDSVDGYAANLGPANDYGRIGPFLQFKIGGMRS